MNFWEIIIYLASGRQITRPPGTSDHFNNHQVYYQVVGNVLQYRQNHFTWQPSYARHDFLQKQVWTLVPIGEER